MKRLTILLQITLTFSCQPPNKHPEAEPVGHQLPAMAPGHGGPIDCIEAVCSDGTCPYWAHINEGHWCIMDNGDPNTPGVCRAGECVHPRLKISTD